ncbi:type IV pilin protein [Candidatus Omnitrophota bacterium]
MGRQKGFTLMEIIVVVGIIVMLAAFAIPQVLRARMNANETTVISALRTISTALQSYYSAVLPHTYPPTLLALAATSPSYIDFALAQATAVATARHGYYYVYNLEDAEHFTVVARPSAFNYTGGRNFFIDELGLTTFNNTEGTDPDENSPPVAQ